MGTGGQHERSKKGGIMAAQKFGGEIYDIAHWQAWERTKPGTIMMWTLTRVVRHHDVRGVYVVRI